MSHTLQTSYLSDLGEGGPWHPCAHWRRRDVLAGEGSWKDKPEDEPVIERTAVIYTYVEPTLFLAVLPALRKFLHRFGRETKQGEVVVEFDSLFYRIRKYDKE